LKWEKAKTKELKDGKWHEYGKLENEKYKE